MILFPSKVLMLDDDASFLDSMSSFLSRVGIESIAFTDPDAARTCLQKNEDAMKSCGIHDAPDVDDPAFEAWVDALEKAQEETGMISCVISDYHMVSVDGLKWLSDLHCHAKKLMISGVFQDAQAIEALNDGVMKRYLQKGRQDFSAKFLQYVRESMFAFFRDLNPKLSPAGSKLKFLEAQYVDGKILDVFPLVFPTIYACTMAEEGDKKIFHLLSKDDLAAQRAYAEECGAPEDVLNAINSQKSAFCSYARENEDDFTPAQWTAGDLTALQKDDASAIYYACENVE